MKTYTKLFILYLISSSLLLINCDKEAHKRVKKGAKLAQDKLDQMVGKQWGDQKPITIYKVGKKLSPVHQNKELKPDFQKHTSNLESLDSYIMPEQQVVKFSFYAEDKLSLDEFIIDFEPENKDQLNLEVYFRKDKKIHSLEDFMPLQDGLEQQKREIEKKGFQSNKSETKESLSVGKQESREKEEQVLMECLGTGIQTIKGKIYPINQEDKALEFYFYKDCNIGEYNKHIQLDVSFFCHHHNMREQITVFEDNSYTKEYKKEDVHGSVYIDKVPPELIILAKDGNQFVNDIRILKVAGPKSRNEVKLKKNPYGGFVQSLDSNDAIHIQLASLCFDQVGEEKWEVSLGLPPYDQRISLRFKTECGQQKEITSYEQFPLLIGTDDEQDNASQWGKIKDEFNINDVDNLIKYGKKVRVKQFKYNVTPVPNSPFTQIDYHNPVLTYDRSIISLYYQMNGSNSISESDEATLTIRMQCLRAGETVVDITQEFDHIDQDIHGKSLEFGFRKVCTGFDYSYDEQPVTVGDNQILRYFVGVIVVMVIVYGLMLVKSGLEENVTKNTELPQFGNTNKQVGKLQDDSEESGAFKRQN